MAQYPSVTGQAQKTHSSYIPINGSAERILKMYVGVNGKAELFYEWGNSTEPPTGVIYLYNQGVIDESVGGLKFITGDYSSISDTGTYLNIRLNGSPYASTIRNADVHIISKNEMELDEKVLKARFTCYTAYATSGEIAMTPGRSKADGSYGIWESTVSVNCPREETEFILENKVGASYSGGYMHINLKFDTFLSGVSIKVHQIWLE